MAGTHAFRRKREIMFVLARKAEPLDEVAGWREGRIQYDMMS